MVLATASCDVAQVVASVCAHASPGVQNLDQYGHTVDESVKAMFLSYLALGPLYWLVLLAVLWAIWKVIGKFWAFVLLFIAPHGKD